MLGGQWHAMEIAKSTGKFAGRWHLASKAINNATTCQFKVLLALSAQPCNNNRSEKTTITIRKRCFAHDMHFANMPFTRAGTYKLVYKPFVAASSARIHKHQPRFSKRQVVTNTTNIQALQTSASLAKYRKSENGGMYMPTACVLACGVKPTNDRQKVLAGASVQ